MNIESWENLRFWKHRWPSVKDYLTNRRKAGAQVLPTENRIFRALETTKRHEVRCVILGQDPYPAPGYADGLAFSVLPHIQKLPRSLQNIHFVYRNDLGFPDPRFGDLSSWARNGVLLLNTILTVEAHRPLGHSEIGWQSLCYEVIQAVSEQAVFILWGNHAKEFAGGIPDGRTVTSSHPSPLSAHLTDKPFLKSKPFSEANALLKALGQEQINWKLP